MYSLTTTAVIGSRIDFYNIVVTVSSAIDPGYLWTSCLVVCRISLVILSSALSDSALNFPDVVRLTDILTSLDVCLRVIGTFNFVRFYSVVADICSHFCPIVFSISLRIYSSTV